MKLRYSATSPYVRKVVATAIETGLDGRVERVATDPWSADTDLPASNPLGKVPALETDDGTLLFDSPVICEYLDSLHDGPKLHPGGCCALAGAAAGGDRRWHLRRGDHPAAGHQAAGEACARRIGSSGRRSAIGRGLATCSRRRRHRWRGR